MAEHRVKPVPPVVRSRQHLIAQGVSFVPPGGVRPATLPITADGVTYTMAQESAWLDQQHFAVGRWDGSLSIFAFNDSPTAGPVISKAVNTPNFEGVQMIIWLAPGIFASSNDESSLIVWSSPSQNWTDLQTMATLKYDPSLGDANSGDSILLGNRLYLAVGHANGFISFWSGNADGTGLELYQTVNVRNPKPTSPWGLHNIRGISTMFSISCTAYVVSGSEDGYISVLSLPNGEIMSQTVYNPAAQRGINSVASFGQNLLVANCSVGSNDKNLWYYWIDGDNFSVTLKDSVNLQVNPSAPQVFNFCAIWGMFNHQVGFFASTEEGALWVGTIDGNQRLSVIGYQNVFGSLGSALVFNLNGKLVVVNYNLYEFTTSPGLATEMVDKNPERLPLRVAPPTLRS